MFGSSDGQFVERRGEDPVGDLNAQVTICRSLAEKEEGGGAMCLLRWAHLHSLDIFQSPWSTGRYIRSHK